MDLSSLLKGLLLGFSIAAPVGPIGVLCLKRSLNEGRWVGFVSGLGAATADAVYGSIAAFGLSVISNFLTGQQRWLRWGGGLFLLYLGAKILVTQPAKTQPVGVSRGLARAYATALALTLTNPLTILSFSAVYAGLGVGTSSARPGSTATLVLGVFCGSALWWLLLSSAAGLLQSKLKDTTIVWVNRVSGMIIIAFGIAALVSII